MNIKTLYIAIISAAVVLAAGCGRNGARGNVNTGYVLKDTIGTPVLTFSATEHDFGRIQEGETVGCAFNFKNTGDADLVLTSVQTSCGCTVSKFSRKPIPPGGSGSIEVSFDSSDRSGRQTKTITVFSNAGARIMMLRITAEVAENR